jgi:hypothetical protein
MPSFTFEKISQPIHEEAAPATEEKHRGVIAHLRDRLVEARVKRSLRKEKGLIARREPKPKD